MRAFNVTCKIWGDWKQVVIWPDTIIQEPSDIAYFLGVVQRRAKLQHNLKWIGVVTADTKRHRDAAFIIHNDDIGRFLAWKNGFGFWLLEEAWGYEGRIPWWFTVKYRRSGGPEQYIGHNK